MGKVWETLLETGTWPWVGYGDEWKSYMLGSLLSQDNQDTLLELQRSQMLDEAAVSIQRVLRGYKYRCWPCLRPLPSPHTHIFSGAYLPHTHTYILFGETSVFVICPASNLILC